MSDKIREMRLRWFGHVVRRTEKRGSKEGVEAARGGQKITRKTEAQVVRQSGERCY